MSETRLLFLFVYLSAFVASTFGRTICGDSGDSYYYSPNWDQQTQNSADSIDTLGTIGVSCETSGGGGGGSGGSHGSNNHLSTILGVGIPVFVLFWVAAGVYIVCVQRQKAAAAIHNPGQSVEVQMQNETYQKAYPTATIEQSGQPTTNQHS